MRLKYYDSTAGRLLTNNLVSGQFYLLQATLLTATFTKLRLNSPANFEFFKAVYIPVSARGHFKGNLHFNKKITLNHRK